MKALYDVNGAAQMLRISPWTIRAHIRDGKLTPVRIGRRVLLEEAELERFVAEARESAAATQDGTDRSVEAGVRPKEDQHESRAS